MLARLRHRPVGRRHDEDRAVHRRRADHVLDVVGVARAVDVRVVALGARRPPSSIVDVALVEEDDTLSCGALAADVAARARERPARRRLRHHRRRAGERLLDVVNAPTPPRHEWSVAAENHRPPRLHPRRSRLNSALQGAAAARRGVNDMLTCPHASDGHERHRLGGATGVQVGFAANGPTWRRAVVESDPRPRAQARARCSRDETFSAQRVGDTLDPSGVLCLKEATDAMEKALAALKGKAKRGSRPVADASAKRDRRCPKARPVADATMPRRWTQPNGASSRLSAGERERGMKSRRPSSPASRRASTFLSFFVRFFARLSLSSKTPCTPPRTVLELLAFNRRARLPVARRRAAAAGAQRRSGVLALGLERHTRCTEEGAENCRRGAPIILSAENCKSHLRRGAGARGASSAIHLDLGDEA